MKNRTPPQTWIFATYFFVVASWMTPLLLGPTVASALPDPADDPWPVVPGWASLYKCVEDEEILTQRWFEGEHQEWAGREVMVVNNVYFGATIGRYQTYFSRNQEGDVFYHGFLDSDNGRMEVYEPPALFLDLPLEENSSWESDVSQFSDTEMTHFVDREYAINNVGGQEIVRTPAGNFNCWPVTDEPISGQSRGKDCYSPGVGLVSYTLGADGPLMHLIANTLDGLESLPGVGNPVKLNFAWPAGLNFGIKQGCFGYTCGAFSDSFSTHLETSYQVNRTPLGLMVKLSNLDLDLPKELGEEDDQAYWAALASRIQNSAMCIMVNHDGEFLETTGSEAKWDSLYSIIRTALEKNPRVGPEISDESMDLFRSLLSPETIEAIAQKSWDLMVGVWLGLEIDMGIVYEGVLENPHSMFSDIIIRSNFFLAAVETCPCKTDSKENDCVRLLYRSRPDREILAEIKPQLLDKFGGQLPEIFQAVNTVEGISIMAIMEPETLLPHQIHLYIETWDILADHEDPEALICGQIWDNLDFSFPD